VKPRAIQARPWSPHLGGRTLPAVARTLQLVPRDSARADWDGKVIWCNYNQDQARILDPANPAGHSILSGIECRYDVKQDAQGRLIFTTNGKISVVS
jgi:hypothetical protein